MVNNNINQKLYFRTEPSRLQSLALQLSDKIGQLVENNERLLEQRGQVIYTFLIYSILKDMCILLLKKEEIHRYPFVVPYEILQRTIPLVIFIFFY